MSTLKIEVGKSYRDRNGSAIRIIRKCEPTDQDYEAERPFVGDDGEYYGESGNFNFDASQKSEFDLLTAVDTPPISLKLGRTYRTRNQEETVKIVALDDPKSLLHLATHPFLGSDGDTYMPNGQVNPNIESEYDLVEEIA